MIKKFLEENKIVLFTTLLIAIIFPIVILCYSPWAPLGRIPRDIGLQLIGYGGSILGGFLTLYGVWWTIKDQDEKRKEDLSIQFMPILVCDQFNVQEKKIENELFKSIYTALISNFDSEIPKKNLREIKICIKISNHGRGEAFLYNIKSNFAIISSSEDNIKQEKYDCSVLEKSSIIIPTNHSIYSSLILSIDISQPFPPKIIYTLWLEYHSLFNNKIINLSLSLLIKTDNQKLKNNKYLDAFLIDISPAETYFNK